MKNNRKLETPDLKPYLIPLILLCGIFLVTSFFLMSGIRQHYYELKKEEALKIARSYGQSLEKFKEAEAIIEGLLEEKIRVSSSMASGAGEELSSDLLEKMALELDIDELDYYDEDGVLLYSNLPEVIGWKIYEGHPIDRFIKSDALFLVEDLRQDVITGNYYKYGYLKVPSGGLIQVGLRADRVQSFLAQYEVDHLLSEMKENQDALSISLLSEELAVLASTKENKHLDMTEKELAMIRASLKTEKEYGAVLSEGEQLMYKVFLRLDEVESGDTLAVSYTMEETLSTIRTVTTYGLLVLVLVFSVLLFSIRVSYEKNKKLRRIAFYDSLTDLPNREYLKEWSRRQDQGTFQGTLVLVNILNFKHINVAYGYDFGDLLLKEVAKRLQKLQKKNLLLFRFSVDRFILLCRDANQRITYDWMAKKVLELFEEPMRIKDLDFPVQITLGGALSTDRGEKITELLKFATVALEEGRKKERKEMLYEKEMIDLFRREEILLKEMREAIEKKDQSTLYLAFQPILSGNGEEVVAFEALARMNSQSFGPVSPMEFIEVAEKNQLIQRLSDCILDCALDFMKELRRQGKSHLRVAVNVSGYQLLKEDFSESLLRRLKSEGIRPQMLEVEITESVLLENFQHLNDKLKKLRGSGVRVALDDFGTGYSSFMRLQELHLDTIKIDQAFIRRIKNEKEETLVSDMIQMAHRLKLQVVAEGVEEEHQRKNLIHFGCDALQGYYYAKPLTPEEALLFADRFKEAKDFFG
ncbi:putative bifunctional diguanylate cyclase/phosphodiesterase [Proteiniclasticum ruminis]|uniref:Diguanylate cyclase (GGDEF) domain-containing protein n=1 Tax=Proteiniclasticum ruminis TaxID=398199 RepID=A0A1I4XMB0_9CLOT|nr:GGDEF domain-containing phosphodiesterase [Proteiniclasticum ruminis]SFN26981.1 diguanylate cyclase (GGDEF) domain-containing protein [Proteiniclasticum ruminis]